MNPAYQAHVRQDAFEEIDRQLQEIQEHAENLAGESVHKLGYAGRRTLRALTIIRDQLEKIRDQ